MNPADEFDRSKDGMFVYLLSWRATDELHYRYSMYKLLPHACPVTHYKIIFGGAVCGEQGPAIAEGRLTIENRARQVAFVL
jgi:hypothetical protein